MTVKWEVVLAKEQLVLVLKFETLASHSSTRCLDGRYFGARFACARLELCFAPSASAYLQQAAKSDASCAVRSHDTCLDVRLQTEDEDDTRMGESETVWRPQDGPPPPYSSVLPAEGQVGAFPPAKPPAYNVAASLPSYEEAEKAKGSNPVPTTVIPAPDCDEDFPGREEGEDGEQLRIGSDGIFMVSFFMAFLFNWVGFFLSFCLTNTIAGRYGAISGFGLSLVKWIIIVRFSDYFTGYFDGQYWLWWIFLMLGLLLFLRGFLNYLKVRKVSDLSSISRTRLLFIY